MEQTILFDTHKSFLSLKEAGFTERQAEAQTNILRELVDGRLATKQDLQKLAFGLKKLETKLQELEARLKNEIKELEARLKNEIKELEVRLKNEIKAEIKAEIKVAQFNTVKWVVGIAFAQFAALAALILKLPL